MTTICVSKYVRGPTSVLQPKPALVCQSADPLSRQSGNKNHVRPSAAYNLPRARNAPAKEPERNDRSYRSTMNGAGTITGLGTRPKAQQTTAPTVQRTGRCASAALTTQ